MRKLAFIAAAGIVAVPTLSLAAPAVSPEVVLGLRQMAIAAGQTSTSRAEQPAVDPIAAEAERKAIDRHREAFFARVRSRDTTHTAAQDTQPTAVKSFLNKDRPTRLGQVILSVPQATAPTVDSETVAALRQLAIDAGQVTRSSDVPAAKSQQAVDAERKAIEGHKANFFARVYGETPVM